jgi:hypothetical protein
MNPQNLFILISQLSLGLFVAANPVAEPRAAENLCDLSQGYENQSFNLYTDRTRGTKLRISNDGQVQAGVSPGPDSYPLTARFDSKPPGGEFPCYGNLGGMDKNMQWTQHGFLSPRRDALTSGGGYAFRFAQFPPTPDPSTVHPEVLFEFQCAEGSPVLVPTHAQSGEQFMGCSFKDGLNVCCRL